MISVVIPVFNEEESLHIFYDRLKAVLPAEAKMYECIFVDDGSTDKSLDILKTLEKKDNTVRIFSFRRNQGKAEALTLGFQKAKGDIVVTLDADLQDRPEEIGKLLKKQEEGYDVVCGWRKDRKDAAKMKFISRIFNVFTGIIWGIKLHDYNCGLKVFTKDAAKSLYLYGGMHRFIPLLAFENGFLVTEVAVTHEKRQFGKSKYGFSKIRNFPDMFTLLFLTRYAKRPLHFFAAAGSIVFLIGLGFFLYLWIDLQIIQHLVIGRRPLFFVSLVMMLAGLQLFFSGFLADLMINLHRAPQLTNDGVHHFLRFDSDLQNGRQDS